MGTRTADELARDMVEWLVKVAASEDHDRLERLLKTLASVAGYKKEVKFKDGTRPDVLRTSERDPGALLIGDAKVAPGDVPGTKKTADQIKGYIQRFKIEAQYTSAVVAIATNTQEAADDWVEALKEWVTAAGLHPGSFSASHPDSNTWFIIGGIDRPLAKAPSKPSTSTAAGSRGRGQSS